MSILLLIMPRTTPSLLPRLQRELSGLGLRLRQARLRRAYAAETIAQRAGITRKTLGRVEQGDPAVSIGIYARVLQALGLDADLALLAKDDELGRRLQDMALKQPRRAPRKKAGSP
ncbi:MAG TPA: helix-turn-helix domain-containing protein [Povalibacter sp.]|nr:helix-turn-helix domain-containing protein [Povalibacter sp.]